MKTVIKQAIIDLLDHKTLLGLFLDYVKECIDDYTHSNQVRPLSFDEWYNREYLPNLDALTTIVSLAISYETAARGQLTGASPYTSYDVRIPANVVTETGGIVDAQALQQHAKAFAQKLNLRLPRVLYKGKLVYAWSWD